jgi:hypothetical protein
VNNPKWEIGPVKLVDGSDAEILRINDRNNCMKYVGVRRVGLDWYPFAWELCGTPSDSAFNAKKLSLAPPPKKTVRVQRYVNVFDDGCMVSWSTREEADGCKEGTRIACIEIDRVVEEGEGL